MKSLDTPSGKVHCVDMGTDIPDTIPEGHGGIWYADAPGIDPATMLQLAAREACRTHLPQIVRLPGGKAITVAPEVSAA